MRGLLLVSPGLSWLLLYLAAVSLFLFQEFLTKVKFGLIDMLRLLRRMLRFRSPPRFVIFLVCFVFWTEFLTLAFIFAIAWIGLHWGHRYLCLGSLFRWLWLHSQQLKRRSVALLPVDPFAQRMISHGLGDISFPAKAGSWTRQWAALLRRAPMTEISPMWVRKPCCSFCRSFEPWYTNSSQLVNHHYFFLRFCSASRCGLRDHFWAFQICIYHISFWSTAILGPMTLENHETVFIQTRTLK